jgi:hypothetical protein
MRHTGVCRQGYTPLPRRKHLGGGYRALFYRGLCLSTFKSLIDLGSSAKILMKRHVVADPLEVDGGEGMFTWTLLGVRCTGDLDPDVAHDYCPPPLRQFYRRSRGPTSK